jgi:hypothetical protein
MSKILGKECHVSAFQAKLNTIADARGKILTKRGERRRHRFRFSNPMMQPFVMLKGMDDGMFPDIDEIA